MTDANAKPLNGALLSTQVFIWIVTIVFGAGVAFATFATHDEVTAQVKEVKDEFQKDRIEDMERIEKALGKLDEKMDKLIDRELKKKGADF